METVHINMLLYKKEGLFWFSQLMFLGWWKTPNILKSVLTYFKQNNFYLKLWIQEKRLKIDRLYCALYTVKMKRKKMCVCVCPLQKVRETQYWIIFVYFGLQDNVLLLVIARILWINNSCRWSTITIVLESRSRFCVCGSSCNSIFFFLLKIYNYMNCRTQK